MPSSCVQQTYHQEPLSHDSNNSNNQNLRFVNPNSLQQHQMQQTQNNPSYDYNQFIKRQQQQQHERRFSYTSMLSDPDQCYLPTISDSSPSNDSEDYSQQETPPSSSSMVSPASVASFIDPIYVELQNKGMNVNGHGLFHHQHAMMIDPHHRSQQQQQQIHYYDPHHKNFSQNNNSLFNSNNRSSIAMMHMGHPQQQQQQQPQAYPISSLCSTPTPTARSVVNPMMNKNDISRPATPVSPPLVSKENNYNNNNESKPVNGDAKVKKAPRSRGRRVSNVPGCGTRMFTCKADGCGKVFKRSEHLKRHIRSIHTLEKPFECPYQSCNKRFSRSDNLNQHIRIHRHSNNNNGNSASVFGKETGSNSNKKQQHNKNNNNSNSLPTAGTIVPTHHTSNSNNIHHHPYNNNSSVFSNFI